MLAVAARSASDGATVDRPRQERLHADGRHPAFEPTCQVPQDVCFADRSRRAVHDQAVVVAAAARIDDDPLAGQPRPGAANQLLFADGVWRAAGDPGTQKVQGAQRFWAADAVGIQAVLALVGHQRVVRLQAEVAVDQSGVEAEVLQPGLQRRDVVAVHRRTELVIERARTQAVRSFFQRTVSRLADDAVDQQAAVLLERAHGVVEVVVEHIHATCLPVVRSSSGLSTSPSAASAARISVTAPPRSPRRRLDIPGLSVTVVSGPLALTKQRQARQHCRRRFPISRKPQAGVRPRDRGVRPRQRARAAARPCLSRRRSASPARRP